MEIRKHAIILGVIESLNEHESWTGKTHVQKALWLLSAVGDIDVPFRFILYKHGPYSFEVEEELEQMKGYAAVAADVTQGAGVSLHAGDMADYVHDNATLSAKQEKAIEQVCKFVGGSNVLELERIATAAWIRTREKIDDPKAVAFRLNELKPHVSVEEANKADMRVVALLNSKCRVAALARIQI